ncbi:hypothetical protein Poli38472_002851 [Pythium oligandrum]|uniref:Glucosidase 2 subunit beta n=1 Tax=Pythium oligandrum TaxID=41045 RepID=A0A8K1FC88_PYTOL|nr:hypothetical protein Poli38472_002851 [Pythium oligandrum]|eukprot:TMW56926.1 hypothetical protein Poli38472_002851 [Pythium oligandrum]
MEMTRTMSSVRPVRRYRRVSAVYMTLLAGFVSLTAIQSFSDSHAVVAAAGSRSTRDQVFVDDDDDDDDDWDFMDNDAIIRATQKPPPQCVDTIDASKLNDDYCDCADGSDEPLTSACARITFDLPSSNVNRLFWCSNSAQSVPLTTVGDGVCDCCDGSDEAPSVCTNTCERQRQDRLAALQSEHKAVRTGQTTRKSYLSFASAKIEALRKEFQGILETTTAYQRAFQHRQQVLQTAETQPTQEEIQQLQGLYYQLNQWQYQAYIHRKLIDDATFDAAQERDAFVVLVGECFPFTVNDKQLKGGSSNVIPREYVIVFCPFQNITQTEPRYAQWQRQEHQTKLGDAATASTTDEPEEESTQPPILMGVWNQWQPRTDSSSKEVAFKQAYDHGGQCMNGKERVVNVDVRCGDSNRVISVEEHEMCVYSLVFATPAACTRAQEVSLVSDISQLESMAMSESSRQEHEEL